MSIILSTILARKITTCIFPDRDISKPTARVTSSSLEKNSQLFWLAMKILYYIIMQYAFSPTNLDRLEISKPIARVTSSSLEKNSQLFRLAAEIYYFFEHSTFATNSYNYKKDYSPVIAIHISVQNSRCILSHRKRMIFLAESCSLYCYRIAYVTLVD